MECVAPQSVAADSRGVEVRTVELVIGEVRFDVFHHWEPWAGVVAATWSVIAGIAVKRGRMAEGGGDVAQPREPVVAEDAVRAPSLLGSSRADCSDRLTETSELT